MNDVFEPRSFDPAISIVSLDAIVEEAIISCGYDLTPEDADDSFGDYSDPAYAE